MQLSQKTFCRQYVSRFGLIAYLLVGGCSNSDHPDRTRYQYLYIDGTLQSPYQSFPQGSERGNWKCFDKKLQSEFSCAMVGGGWEHFQYIYRVRG
jgi:major membrane immunogen (membrane-anchored lipoprotein)